MPAYENKFAVGTTVRIAELPQLEEFRRSWRFHHALEPAQLRFAGRSVRVASVSFYHGGDVLYGLEDVPGIWHERCLRGPA